MKLKKTPKWINFKMTVIRIIKKSAKKASTENKSAQISGMCVIDHNNFSMLHVIQFVWDNKALLFYALM